MTATIKTPNYPSRTLARILKLIEDLAAENKRLPRADEISDVLAIDGCVGAGHGSRPLYELVARGYIELRTYGQNWRVAEILVGPHQGRATAPTPHPTKIPCRIFRNDVEPPPYPIDTSGDTSHGRAPRVRGIASEGRRARQEAVKSRPPLNVPAGWDPDRYRAMLMGAR